MVSMNSQLSDLVDERISATVDDLLMPGRLHEGQLERPGRLRLIDHVPSISPVDPRSLRSGAARCLRHGAGLPTSRTQCDPGPAGLGSDPVAALVAKHLIGLAAVG